MLKKNMTHFALKLSFVDNKKGDVVSKPKCRSTFAIRVNLRYVSSGLENDFCVYMMWSDITPIEVNLTSEKYTEMILPAPKQNSWLNTHFAGTQSTYKKNTNYINNCVVNVLC